MQIYFFFFLADKMEEVGFIPELHSVSFLKIFLEKKILIEHNLSAKSFFFAAYHRLCSF